MSDQTTRNKPHPFFDSAFYATVEFIIAQFSKTVVVFYRFDFGERYFRIGLFGGTVAFFLLTSLGSNLFGNGLFQGLVGKPLQRDAPNTAPLGLFFIGVAVMSLVHLAAMKISARFGRRIHSHYNGTSFITQFFYYVPKRFELSAQNATLLAYLIPDVPFFVKRYIEPFITVVLGYFIGTYFNDYLGIWLIFAGLCLGVNEYLINYREYDRILDAIDAQIEAKNLTAALAGNKTPQETEGFVLPVPRYFSQQQRNQLQAGMLKLDPALQAILDTPENEEIHKTPVEN